MSTFIGNSVLFWGSTASSVLTLGADGLVNAFVVVVLFEKLPHQCGRCDEAKSVWSLGFWMGN